VTVQTAIAARTAKNSAVFESKRMVVVVVGTDRRKLGDDTGRPGLPSVDLFRELMVKPTIESL